MKNYPIDYNIVSQALEKNNITNVSEASIREIKKLINDVEKASGKEFIRMEMGVPGLPACEIGVKAEIEALQNGVAAIYPEIYGTDELKEQMSLFAKNFLNLSIPTDCCVPTVGSMQGGFAAFMTIARMNPKKNKVLFINPGFPVQRQQVQILDIPHDSFDIYDYRGDKLRNKLESYLATGEFSSLLYSTPNNPAWFCLTEEELKIIGEVAEKYDVIVIEDLAYFGMDFRKDYSKPGVAPYQPSASHYTKKYLLLISSSKAFSYAGQRIGMMLISPDLYNSKSEGLKKYYNTDSFGRAMVFGSLYVLSSGTAHSPQYALTAMLKAANEGRYNFVNDVKEYGEKAALMKKMFLDNGFKLVYDNDLGEPLADGFYFTVSYPTFDGNGLLTELLYHGISAIALGITGSDHTEGLRACVSLVPRRMFPELEARLKQFHANNPL